MKTLRLTRFGNPILRNKTKKIRPAEVEKTFSKALVKQMFFTMRRINGVGLAAPQIGKSIQLAVIEIDKTKTRPSVKPLKPTVIINPKILSHSKEVNYDWEGCLSFDGARGLVPRYNKVEVSYFDENFKKIVAQFTGFQARVFQHEIDHLNGLVYPERMTNMKDLITLEEFKKRILKKGLKSK
jgi:peptide deformylase